MLNEGDLLLFDDRENFLKTLKKKLPSKKYNKILDRVNYNNELLFLQSKLVDLQNYIKNEKLRVCIIFEGRDAAGKGGAIKRFAQHLNPRNSRIVALPEPTLEEKGQWYFQRYIQHLPTAGEIVIFDRSWYNRAGVERVMGFCSEAQYNNFLSSCPIFENLLIQDGIKLIKYWFSVSDDEQEKRFQERASNPLKNWKLSPMDLESRNKWVEYSKAKDLMFEHTDTDRSPWWVVDGEEKKRARLNCIEHLLSQFEYSDFKKTKVKLPVRRKIKKLSRPPIDTQKFVPKIW